MCSRLSGIKIFLGQIDFGRSFGSVAVVDEGYWGDLSSTMRPLLTSLIARAATSTNSSSTSVCSRGSGTKGVLGRLDLGRNFGSVAVVDEEDDRPPSLRKSVSKEVEAALRAFPREKTGKNWCKKDRKLGLVPSIVFEQENGHLGGNKRLIAVEKKQVENIVKKIGQSFFLSRTFDLETYDQPGGEMHSRERVLPRQIHFHSATDELLNVTFIRAPAHSRLKVEIPLVFIGEDSCPGIRKGGYVNTMKRVVSYLCPGGSIPPFLEVDISTLDVGDKVLLRDMKVDPQLRLLHKDSSLPILKIMGTRVVEATSTK